MRGQIKLLMFGAALSIQNYWFSRSETEAAGSILIIFFLLVCLIWLGSMECLPLHPMMFADYFN